MSQLFISLLFVAIHVFIVFQLLQPIVAVVSSVLLQQHAHGVSVASSYCCSAKGRGELRDGLWGVSWRWAEVLGASEVGGGQIPYTWVAVGGFRARETEEGPLYFFLRVALCGVGGVAIRCGKARVVFDPYFLFYAE